eukprot:COSAG02_NODE_19671_length_870_cov_1.103761_1_plen_77_part_10
MTRSSVPVFIKLKNLPLAASTGRIHSLGIGGWYGVSAKLLQLSTQPNHLLCLHLQSSNLRLLLVYQEADRALIKRDQ